jgi:hypothetical protein
MVYHRLFSISAVFGGKNSKEIAGWLCARDVAGAGMVSLMTFENLRNKTGWRAVLSSRPKLIGPT